MHDTVFGPCPRIKIRKRLESFQRVWIIDYYIYSRNRETMMLGDRFLLIEQVWKSEPFKFNPMFWNEPIQKRRLDKEDSTRFHENLANIQDFPM